MSRPSPVEIRRVLAEWNDLCETATPVPVTSFMRVGAKLVRLIDALVMDDNESG